MKVLVSQDPDKTVTTITIVSTSSLSPIEMCGILQEMIEQIRSSTDDTGSKEIV